ncbi:MAG: cell division protein FtsK [Acidiferrobacteraceae bacterium]|nr:cell division protein FtsK [Acidiferrobacteraceae bacterium]
MKALPNIPPRLARLGREVLVIAYAALTLYLLVSLVTYSDQDPSFTFTGTGSSTQNLGGSFGAWFSDLFFHAFGYTAFLFPAIFALLSWRTFKYQKEKPAKYIRAAHTIGLLLALFSACGLEHIHFPREASILLFEAGGWVGSLSGVWLLMVFGIVGATVILLVMFIAAISWALDVSWFFIMDWIGKWTCKGFDWLLDYFKSLIDQAQGLSIRKKREKIGTGIKKGSDGRASVRIEPKISPPKAGARIYKEKQTPIPIFAEETVPNGALPPLGLLDTPKQQSGGYSKETLEMMSRLVEKKLLDFNIQARVESVQPGPVITRFEVDPAPGVKASQIVGLSRDLARALSVVSVRVVENIPGKTFIGLEIPNEERETVHLLEGLASEIYESSKSPLSLVLGKDIAGQTVISDLAKMPHVLIAGTTGAGKSVCINALILSIVYKSTPDDVRLILIDPKMLELSTYDGIPHLLTPVVTDMQKAGNALRWCMNEMDRRFRLMSALGVRNIVGYNRKVLAAHNAGQPLFDPLQPQTDDEERNNEQAVLSKMPYIVVIIDELADLFMVVGKKVEELITRIAQRARAAGIHLVVATQRPSVDVVTGLIKANIPTRIAFQVSSRADSRTVLDQMGAEQLLGHGDMLFLPPGTGFPVRVHGSLVSDQEVHKVTEQLRNSGVPEYLEGVLDSNSNPDDLSSDFSGGNGEEDPLYDQAVAFVAETRRASISSVQRQLRVGYNRAARMIEAMETAGVVSTNENGKREVLVPRTQMR